MDLAGKRVLITGATGLIGNRLVEVLGERPGIEVQALVRQFMNASRIARFPVKMYAGSVTDEDAVSAAMKGVDVVFHLAFGTSGSDQERRNTTVEGTRVICEAALRSRVSRVVYTSTFSVYGVTEGSELTEETARKKSGDVYADSKLEAENLVLEMHRTRGLPAVILQPTIVHGPFSFWSRWPIEQLRRGTVVLPDGGQGICNAVYIDDVVSALLRAAVASGVEGHAFLISDREPSTWLRYYESYARMVEGAVIDFEAYGKMRETVLRPPQPPGMSDLLKRGIRSVRLRQAILSVPAAHAVYRGIRAGVPRPLWQRMRGFSNPPPPTPTRERCYPFPSHLELLRSPTRVRVDKAISMLDWQPQVPLSASIAKTQAWATWFGLEP